MNTIPPAEFPKRWQKVQDLMEKENLDLLLAFGKGHDHFH